jgi:ABC-2 type transport system permease protein
VIREKLEPVALILEREVLVASGSMWGWGIFAGKLLIDGLLFHTFAMTDTPRFGAEVLADFFYILFGTTILLGVLLTMRLFPEERSQKSMALLMGAPIASWQIILGKYLSALTILATITAASVYLPLLVLLHGRISWSQVGVGYLGVTLVGMATCAIGTWMSSIARTQLQAALLTSGVMVALLLGWLISSLSAPPLDAFFAATSFYDAHFKGFIYGRIHTSAVAYYMGLTALPLWFASLQMQLERRA